MHYRSVFISDTHLGSITCDAEALFQFLKDTTCDNLFLCGDIIDFWALNRKIYFPQEHMNVVRKLLKKSKQGTKIIWVVGNHDEVLRQFTPLQIANISIVDEAIYESAVGKKYLILHGDQFDQIMLYARWLAWLGDIGYCLLLQINRNVNRIRRRCGFRYWSVSAYIKSQVKSAVNFVSHYEQAIVKRAMADGFDGIVCGHIHTPDIRKIEDIAYVNCGDWCESLTAIVEHDDGGLHLLKWHNRKDTTECDCLS